MGYSLLELVVKGAFRRSMGWLHTWAGLALGWLLFFVFLTGTAGYFDTEIDRWMKPELPMSTNSISQEEFIAMGLKHLEEQAAWSNTWQIILPNGRNDILKIGWRKEIEDGGRIQREFINYETNQIVETRVTAGGQTLYRLHYRLHYMPAIVGFWIVGLASMFMLLALVTGIIIHIRIFKDFFTFRPKQGAKSWLDAHSVVSVIALPFHLMITYSGLLFFVFTYMSIVAIANYEVDEIKNLRSEAIPRHAPIEPAGIAAPLVNLIPLVVDAKKHFGDDEIHMITIFNPNDKSSVVSIRRQNTTLINRNSVDEVQYNGVTGTQLIIPPLNRSVTAQTRSIFLGLHEGYFAGIIVRWFYFISGLLGTMMIATGMLLWVEKRRFKYENKQAPTKGYILVNRINAGVIIGLPMAIAVYFIANRLLPVEIANRGAWEINALFISLGLFIIYPFLRPLKKFWIEMLVGAAILCFAVPIINALTTDKNIIATALAQDWTLFSFDLTMLLFGGMFIFAAVRVQQRSLQPAKKKSNRASPKKLPQANKNIAINQPIATRNILANKTKREVL